MLFRMTCWTPACFAAGPVASGSKPEAGLPVMVFKSSDQQLTTTKSLPPPGKVIIHLLNSFVLQERRQQ